MRDFIAEKLGVICAVVSIAACAILYIIQQYTVNNILSVVWYISLLSSATFILWKLGNLVYLIMSNRRILGVSFYLWLALALELVVFIPKLVSYFKDFKVLLQFSLLTSNEVFLYEVPIMIAIIISTIVLMIRSRY